jgi:hypothetical protein
VEKFSNEVCEELKYYVYRLVDPRNGQTFYVNSFSKFAEILEKHRICESAISTITKTITFILNA